MLKNEMESYVRIGGRGLKNLTYLYMGVAGVKNCQNHPYVNIECSLVLQTNPYDLQHTTATDFPTVLLKFMLLHLFTEPMHWLANVTNLIWLRNHLVAPLSEEFTFRACMLPLLLQCFRPMTAVFVCPLFFGVGKRNIFVSYK